MLTRTSAKVLRCLKEINFEYHDIDTFSKLLPKLSKHDVEQTLWYLNGEGYISCQPGDGTVYALSAKYKGAHYGEFQWADTKSFLMRSVFTPIFVSVVTTLITLTISRML